MFHICVLCGCLIVIQECFAGETLSGSHHSFQTKMYQSYIYILLFVNEVYMLWLFGFCITMSNTVSPAKHFLYLSASPFIVCVKAKKYIKKKSDKIIFYGFIFCLHHEVFRRRNTYLDFPYKSVNIKTNINRI